MNFDQSFYLLEKARSWKILIEEKYKIAVVKKELSMDMQGDVRYFTLDLFSVLDYCASEILEQYCIKYIDPSKHEQARRDVAFPTRFDILEFQRRMDKIFPNLKEDQSEIYLLIQTSQAPWLKKLKRLNDHNKHRRLAPQKQIERVEVGMSVNNYPLIRSPKGYEANVTIENCFFGDQYIASYSSEDKDKHNKLVQYKEIVTWDDILFKDLNEPLLDVVKELFTETENILNKLKTFV